MNVNDILKSGVSAGYNVDIAREFGINEAIVLNKLVYLHQIAKRGDGFTWYTAKDWKEHTGLSYYQVNKALQHLVNAGIVEVKNTYIQGTTTKAKHHRFAVQETSKSGIQETSKSGIQETSKSGIQETSKSVNNNAINNAKNIVSNSEVSKKLLDLLNEKTKRNFRILPRGYKETLKKFSLEEISKALDILVEDDWHSKKINELKSDYLLRASTIDNMLSKRKKQHEGMADLDELMGDGSWMA
nr:MAG TPA: helix-turn-helix domain protein [Caudoviricetes sp.]